MAREPRKHNYGLKVFADNTTCIGWVDKQGELSATPVGMTRTERSEARQSYERQHPEHAVREAAA